MKTKNQKFVFAFAVLTGLLFSTDILAQPGNPDAPAPLGFTEILIGAGLVYGGARAKFKKK